MGRVTMWNRASCLGSNSGTSNPSHPESYAMTRSTISVMAGGLVGLFLLCFVAESAEAQVRFRKPFGPWYRVSAHFDNNGPAAGCVDYACRSNCYNPHTGTDYAMPVGTHIVAAAPGTVIARNDGCANYGSFGNTCGGRCGNYVRLQHDDGTHTLYCHMERGTPIQNGTRVSCGQYLGRSASSGSSTGPHLHFGFMPGGYGAARDPYHGSCATAGSRWVGQGAYNDNPSTSCQTNCACSPGQTQTEGCGRCGRRTRTCNSSCQWTGWSGCSGEGVCSPGQSQNEGCGRCGRRSRTCNSSCQWAGWSGCSGEGVCSPGQSQSQACCDCGTQTRSCGSNCQWAGWGTCGGPDPSPRESCDTELLGVCADGTVRCQGGCRTCVQDVEASDEVCDGLDNNCNGVTDEGNPPLGDGPPPPFAATRIDASLPSVFDRDGLASGWVRFRNDGTETWEHATLFLRLYGDSDTILALRDRDTWNSWDVPAIATGRAEPGESLVITFVLRRPAARLDPHEPLRLHLESLIGGPLKCPTPDMAFTASFVVGEEEDRTSVRNIPVVVWLDEPKEPESAGGPTDETDAGGDVSVEEDAGTGDVADAAPTQAPRADMDDNSTGQSPDEFSSQRGCIALAGRPSPSMLPFATLLGQFALCRRRTRDRMREPGVA